MLQMGGVPRGEPEFGVGQHSPHQGGEGGRTGCCLETPRTEGPLGHTLHFCWTQLDSATCELLFWGEKKKRKKKSLCFYEPPVQRNVIPNVLTLYRPEITLLFSFMGGSSGQGWGNGHGSVSAAPGS